MREDWSHNKSKKPISWLQFWQMKIWFNNWWVVGWTDEEYEIVFDDGTQWMW